MNQVRLIAIYLEDIMMENDLVDIWRIRNPDSKKFTWKQKSPIIQRRLDYWLISNTLQEDVVKIDIVSAIKTDHLAITLEIDSLVDQPRGPSFWKFNNSLLDDPVLVQKKEIDFCEDMGVKWDRMKYKIRQESISYSKLKAKERREKLQTIENKLKICQEKIAESPTDENLVNLEAVKAEFEREYDYIIKE